MSELVPQGNKEPAPNLLAIVERAAQNPEVDADKMQRLLTMAREERAYSAELEFNDAMNRAQAQIGSVLQDKKSDKGLYATYSALDRVVRPSYTSLGFSLSFDTGESPDASLLVLCYVSHRAGHTRTYRVLMPADGKGAKGNDVMTKTHATGSAFTYGKRYLLKAIFNIVETDDLDDDDGEAASGEAEDQRIIRLWKVELSNTHDLDAYEALRKRIIDDYRGESNIPVALKSSMFARKKELRQ